MKTWNIMEGQVNIKRWKLPHVEKLPRMKLSKSKELKQVDLCIVLSETWSYVQEIRQQFHWLQNIEKINVCSWSEPKLLRETCNDLWQGLYFACDASYSSVRHIRLPTVRVYMHYAKVLVTLVGEYTTGNLNMIVSPSELYDLVVDSPIARYVVFQDNRYYTKYLITIE